MTAAEALALARAALEDDWRATPGLKLAVDAEADAAAIEGPDGDMVTLPFGRAYSDACFYVNARTREPTIARALIAAHERIATLEKVVAFAEHTGACKNDWRLADRCTCGLHKAREAATLLRAADEAEVKS